MNLWLILLFLIVGFFIGFIFYQNSKLKIIAGYIVHFGLLFLIFVMGAQIGADDEVINNLGKTGIQALILALGTIVGSLLLLQLFSVILMKIIDKNQKQVNKIKNKESNIMMLTIQILFIVVSGILVGLLIMPQDAIPVLESLTVLSLGVLLLGVGVEIGQNKKIYKEIKILGFKILLIPIIVAIGSIFGGIVSGYLIGLPYNESAAVGSGFGWYSLSAVILTDIHSVELGSLAFMTNIIRELLALVMIPITATYVSKLSAIAPGGATTMDVTLPLITKASGEEYIVPAFINGLVLSVLVPVLVPILINL